MNIREWWPLILADVALAACVVCVVMARRLDAKRRRRASGYTGWWAGGGFDQCARPLPIMPVGVPAGMIWRCPECRSEWTWTPAPSRPRSGQQASEER